jgi:predicted NUDIX family NTP pyrophosphohydrolase
VWRSQIVLLAGEGTGATSQCRKTYRWTQSPNKQDVATGEDVEACARREMIEETGYSVDALDPIATM